MATIGSTFAWFTDLDSVDYRNDGTQTSAPTDSLLITCLSKLARPISERLPNLLDASRVQNLHPHRRHPQRRMLDTRRLETYSLSPVIDSDLRQVSVGDRRFNTSGLMRIMTVTNALSSAQHPTAI
ncbi:MAG: hypothetical protein MZU97_24345 [Bacillus subtilis]|nr:hypothetical protein [Bacillus subtilis]